MHLFHDVLVSFTERRVIGMKKKFVFLVAVTPNIAFAAGNIAIALDKYMHDEEYDIIVYYTELPDRDIKALKNINRCIPIQFRPNAKLVDYLLLNLPDACPYKAVNKLMLLAHYEIFRLLDQYETAVWLDADILVQGNLRELSNYVPFGISQDTPWLIRDQFISPKTICVEGYNIDKPAFCTAVMVANESLPYKKIYNWLIDKTYFYAADMKNVDQVTTNLMIEEFGLLPETLPLEKWQCMPWKREAFTAAIVHFGTSDKIWKSPELCHKFSEWYRNHLIWLQLGGSDFRSRIDLMED